MRCGGAPEGGYIPHKHMPSTDAEFYLLGRLESRRPEDYRSPARTDIRRMIRGHHCDDVEIFGGGGYSDGKK